MSLRGAVAGLLLCSVIVESGAAQVCGDQAEAGVLVARGKEAYVKFTIEPAPPPLADLFTVQARVCSHAHSPLEGELSADALMPAHGHGMNYEVPAVATREGAARLQGFFWHMPGVWRIRFRLRTGEHSYRAEHDYSFVPR